jgi:hypothetical protein
MSRPSHPPWFDDSNNIWWSSSLCSLLQPPATFSVLGHTKQQVELLRNLKHNFEKLCQRWNKCSYSCLTVTSGLRTPSAGRSVTAVSTALRHWHCSGWTWSADAHRFKGPCLRWKKRRSKPTGLRPFSNLCKMWTSLYNVGKAKRTLNEWLVTYCSICSYPFSSSLSSTSLFNSSCFVPTKPCNV